MKKALFLFYGIIAYLIFLASFVYAIGFIGNLFVPKSIDGVPQTSVFRAILTDVSLLLLFALQHTVMARPAFKRWWIKIIPQPLERSTYVLFASLCLLLMMWQWQPIGGVVWSVESETMKTILFVCFLSGWWIVLVSTFLINHFDLFGLRQVWFYFTEKTYTDLPFGVPIFYRFVRHPLYFGFLIAFWSTPLMTATHLLFALLTTGYILTAVRLEEKDLNSHFGRQYSHYAEDVPMIIPFIKTKKSTKLAIDDNPWNGVL